MSEGVSRLAVGRDLFAVSPAVTTLPLFRELDGEAYLASRTVDDRRESGAVYTPPALVEFVLDQASFAPSCGAPLGRLLDPACGAGVFLTAAVDRHARQLESEGMALEAAAGRKKLLQDVAKGIFGIDIDPTACDLARSAVRERVAAWTGRPVPPTFFLRNVVTADFLTDELPLPRAAAPISLIVGNPPLRANHASHGYGQGSVAGAISERLRSNRPVCAVH